MVAQAADEVLRKLNLIEVRCACVSANKVTIVKLLAAHTLTQMYVRMDGSHMFAFVS